MKRNGFISEFFFDEVIGLHVPWDDDRELVVLDEFELFGSRAVLEKEGEIAVLRSVFEFCENALCVPLGLLLVVVFVEVGLDGCCGQRIVRVEIEDLVPDIGGFPEVAFGGGVLGVEYVDVSTR